MFNNQLDRYREEQMDYLRRRLTELYVDVDLNESQLIESDTTANRILKRDLNPSSTDPEAIADLIISSFALIGEWFNGSSVMYEPIEGIVVPYYDSIFPVYIIPDETSRLNASSIITETNTLDEINELLREIYQNLANFARYDSQRLEWEEDLTDSLLIREGLIAQIEKYRRFGNRWDPIYRAFRGRRERDVGAELARGYVDQIATNKLGRSFIHANKDSPTPMTIYVHTDSDLLESREVLKEIFDYLDSGGNILEFVLTARGDLTDIELYTILSESKYATVPEYLENYSSFLLSNRQQEH